MVQEHEDCKRNVELCRRGVITCENMLFPVHVTHIDTWRGMKCCLIQPERITKSSCNRLIVTNFRRTVHLNFCFALKPTTGGKSEDGSKPLEDLEEAERL